MNTQVSLNLWRESWRNIQRSLRMPTQPQEEEEEEVKRQVFVISLH